MELFKCTLERTFHYSDSTLIMELDIQLPFVPVPGIRIELPDQVLGAGESTREVWDNDLFNIDSTVYVPRLGVFLCGEEHQQFKCNATEDDCTKNFLAASNWKWRQEPN